MKKLSVLTLLSCLFITTFSYSADSSQVKCLKQKKLETGSLVKAYQLCSIKNPVKSK
jgi:hypothetical protein